MSSNFEPTLRSGRLIVTSPTPECRFRLLNGDLHELEIRRRDPYSADFGELPPGSYRAEAAVGSLVSDENLILQPGRRTIVNLNVRPNCIAPVLPDNDIQFARRLLASELSAATSGAKGSSLVLLLLKHPERPLNLENVEILNSQQSVILNLSNGAQVATDGSAVGRSEELVPGPYLLRTSQQKPNRSEVDQADQTIWLSDGWQTLIFLPDSETGPQGMEASIHMVPIDSIWGTQGTEAANEINWIQYKSRMPATWLDASSSMGLCRDPLSRVILIYRLLLSGDVIDYRHAFTVLGELIRTVGSVSAKSHPDILAVMWALFEPESLYGDPQPLTWPPMLYDSWATLLLNAQPRIPALEPGTPAERVSASIQNATPWLQWSPLEDLQAELLPDGTPGGPPEAAIALIRRIVGELARFHGLSNDDAAIRLTPRDLADRARLPVSLVQASLDSLR